MYLKTELESVDLTATAEETQILDNLKTMNLEMDDNLNNLTKYRTKMSRKYYSH